MKSMWKGPSPAMVVAVVAMLTARLTVHEQTAWMLRSLLAE